VQHSLKSQAQMPSFSASCRTNDRRTGSARAESSWTSGSVLRIGGVYRCASILTTINMLGSVAATPTTEQLEQMKEVMAMRRNDDCCDGGGCCEAAGGACC